MTDEGVPTFCTCEPVVDAHFDPDDRRTVIGAIVEAVAEAAEVDPVELPPLFDVVDPDAIDGLLGRPGLRRSDGTAICFPLDRWNVFVRGDGHIRVCDSTRRGEPRPVFESPQPA